MKLFKPKLIDTMRGYSPSKLLSDVTAGIIVAIIALPLSIALAIASGVSPERGLYTAIFAGFVIAACGGSAVNISGPTAAFATIVAGIVMREGISGLIMATLLAGVILIIMGLLRLGSLIKYIPVTITVGFTSGIAVTILIGQLKDFFGLIYAPGVSPVETMEKAEAVIKSFGTFNFSAFLVGGIALAILILWPMLGRIKRLSKFAEISKKLPPSIIAVAVGILMLAVIPMDVSTIGSLYPTLPSSFPAPSLPAFSWDTVVSVLPDACTIALLAAIESLLSCVVSDGMIGDRHSSNTELIAQGLGNICSGLFGGIPATGAIARTSANVKNGGKTPIAGMVHGVVLLLFLLILMPVAKLIPMPVIAAILIMVAYNMSEWRHFLHICRTAPLTDILVMAATFLLTVIFDLVVAIAIGLALTALIFLKKTSDATHVRVWKNEGGITLPQSTAVYEIHGAMFFASSDKFLELTPPEGIRTLILRMSFVTMIDASAVSSIEKLVKLCGKKEVKLIFSHVTEGAMTTLQKAGIVDAVGAEAFTDSITSALALAEQNTEN